MAFTLALSLLMARSIGLHDFGEVIPLGIPFAAGEAPLGHF